MPPERADPQRDASQLHEPRAVHLVGERQARSVAAATPRGHAPRRSSAPSLAASIITPSRRDGRDPARRLHRQQAVRVGLGQHSASTPGRRNALHRTFADILEPLAESSR